MSALPKEFGPFKHLKHDEETMRANHLLMQRHYNCALFFSLRAGQIAVSGRTTIFGQLKAALAAQSKLSSDERQEFFELVSNIAFGICNKGDEVCELLDDDKKACIKAIGSFCTRNALDRLADATELARLHSLEENEPYDWLSLILGSCFGTDDTNKTVVAMAQVALIIRATQRKLLEEGEAAPSSSDADDEVEDEGDDDDDEEDDDEEEEVVSVELTPTQLDLKRQVNLLYGFVNFLFERASSDTVFQCDVTETLRTFNKSREAQKDKNKRSAAEAGQTLLPDMFSAKRVKEEPAAAASAAAATVVTIEDAE